LGSRIRHFHLTDNDGVADRHWPLERGQIDFAGLMRALTTSGYSGALILEIDTDDWSEHIASKAFLERLVRASW
jgi:sugar phosphate isomerase/epimerase